MSLKEVLKKNKILRKTVKKLKIRKEFNKDYRNFSKYYIEADNMINHTEYELLLLVHSLEKGMSNEKLRPFGEKKVLEIIDLLNKYKNYKPENYSTSYKMGIEILKEWKKIYDDNSWSKSIAYNSVSEFLGTSKVNTTDINVGTMPYLKETIEKYKNFNYLEAISTRHSVRKFQTKKIEEKDLKYCLEAAMLTPSACNRQMCKIYYIENEEKAKVLSNIIMGLSGFEKETVNFFVITYDLTAFSFYGERNQGNINAGLFAMNFVNAMHFKGIGSCFLQWGNTSKEEEHIKKCLNIPDNEKIAIVIGAGYYVESNRIPKSQRKKVEEVFKKI